MSPEQGRGCGVRSSKRGSGDITVFMGAAVALDGKHCPRQRWRCVSMRADLSESTGEALQGEQPESLGGSAWQRTEFLHRGRSYKETKY